MIKMIVTDMDGTLLGADGLTSRTVQALLAATQRGIEFVVATGRDWSGVNSFFERHQIPFSAILGNGAQYCNESGEIVLDAYLNKALFADIIAVFDAMDIHYMIFATDGFYATKAQNEVAEAFIQRGVHRFKRTREQILSRWQASGPIPCMLLKKIDSVETFLQGQREIIKIEAFDVDETKIEKAKQILGKIPGIAFLSSFPDNVEVTHQDAQKGLILEKVIASKGISKEEVAVFGDGLNDITMFELFPESYAMGNAVQEIQALAKYHLPSNEEDGVAQAIEHLLQ